METDFAAYIPRVLIVVMAVIGPAFTAAHCLTRWRTSTVITKAVYIYVMGAFAYNTVLHVARILGSVVPQGWYTYAAVLAVSALAMRAIIDTGKGARL